MNASDIREELRTILEDGPGADLYRAQEAFSITQLIGNLSPKLNETEFGSLLGVVQDAMVNRYTLSLCKVFEPTSNRFSIRSLPSILDFLEKHSEQLKVEQCNGISEWLSTHDGSGKSNIRAFIDAARQKMPNISKADDCALSRSLDSLRTLRDKSFAHNEAFDPSDVYKATWEEAQSLAKFSKDLIGAIGLAFLSIAYTTDNREYTLDSDADRSSRALARLLARAGLGRTDT